MSLGINSRTFTELREEIKVGNYSMIAGECVFHGPNDNHLVKYNKLCVFTDNEMQPGDKKDIEIGNDVWLGRGVKILPGVKIGNGVIIGAWSVVAKDAPDYAVVVGNPATVIRKRFTDEQIERLLKIKWWNWNPVKIEKARKDMLNIDTFLEKYE